MKILFVAMSESVHTARWIRQLDEQGHDLHLFPSIETSRLHPQLHGGPTFHAQATSSCSGSNAKGFPMLTPMMAGGINLVVSKLYPERSVERLVRLIRKLKPDLVHSMELQAAGYLSLKARMVMGAEFPPWMVSNWGSDIYLFGQLAEHRGRLRSLLQLCDYYLCECQRDIGLAQDLGLRGEALGVIPGGGGMPLARISPWRSTPPSARKRILLKGYQGWAGRALCGLRAIEMVADVLRPFEIVIYLPNPEVELKARLIAESTGLNIRLLPEAPHDTMLRLHGQARVSMGLSLSDAASTSFLEAMAMGSFPIQSYTACADEWVTDGETALLVPPEEPQTIADALRCAVSDDALVDEAARLNYLTVVERLADDFVRGQVVNVYNRVLQRRTALPACEP